MCHGKQARCLGGICPKVGINQIQTPMENEAGLRFESLLDLSEQNARAGVNLKLFRALRERKVGTIECEQTALKIGGGLIGRQRNAKCQKSRATECGKT